MRGPVTIQLVYVGADNVPKSVAADIRSRVQADFEHFAPPGTKVSVAGRYESIGEATQHPHMPGTVVLFVLGREATNEALRQVSASQEGLIAKLVHNFGVKLSEENIEDIQAHLAEGRGAAVIGHGVGVVTATGNALTGPDYDPEDVVNFGVTLFEHELGHALGLKDNNRTPGQMMEGSIGAAAQPHPPTRKDMKRIQKELKNLQGELHGDTGAMAPDAPMLADGTAPDALMLADGTAPDTPPDALMLPDDTPPDALMLPDDTPPDALMLPDDTPPDALMLPDDTPPDALMLPDDTPPDALMLPDDTPPDALMLPDDTPPDALMLPDDTPPDALMLPDDTPPDDSDEFIADNSG